MTFKLLGFILGVITAVIAICFVVENTELTDIEQFTIGGILGLVCSKIGIIIGELFDD